MHMIKLLKKQNTEANINGTTVLYFSILLFARIEIINNKCLPNCWSWH